MSGQETYLLLLRRERLPLLGDSPRVERQRLLVGKVGAVLDLVPDIASKPEKDCMTVSLSSLVRADKEDVTGIELENTMRKGDVLNE